MKWFPIAAYAWLGCAFAGAWAVGRAQGARAAAPGPAPTTSSPPPPRDIPTGSYTCATIATGFYGGSSTNTAIGKLQVVGSGAYTGLSKVGTGIPSRFAYDPASGRVRWAGGALKGFSGKVVDSRFGLDNNRVPYFGIVYRVREGGRLFDLSCRLERP